MLLGYLDIFIDSLLSKLTIDETGRVGKTDQCYADARLLLIYLTDQSLNNADVRIDEISSNEQRILSIVLEDRNSIYLRVEVKSVIFWM